ncbi:MAG TPA: hypothetical protein VHC21_01845 [Candidatus Saccharimonadales bacterium]|nr:hypothetical protein [Candidatus Saccharimonadales bacterium]
MAERIAGHGLDDSSLLDGLGADAIAVLKVADMVTIGGGTPPEFEVSRSTLRIDLMTDPDLDTLVYADRHGGFKGEKMPPPILQLMRMFSTNDPSWKGRQL